MPDPGRDLSNKSAGMLSCSMRTQTITVFPCSRSWTC